MGHVLLGTWIALGIGDAMSTHASLNRGAHELYLPDGASIPLAVSADVAGGLATCYLWTHDHKRMAVLLTIGAAGFKGWAIAHNLRTRPLP